MTTRSKITAALLACGLSIALANSAVAATCGDRKTIVDHLAERYGEARRLALTDARGGLIEVMVNETTGTWTVLRSRPSGNSCVLETGVGWLLAAPRPAGEPL